MSAGASRYHLFPWREQESYSGNRVLRPMVDVTLELGVFATTTVSLVDTGAPRSVFPRGTGDALGIEFPDLRSLAPNTVILMGREWPAVPLTVSLDLPPFQDLGWEAEVDFVFDEGLPFALLGYEGFLNRWAVSFNAYMGYFVVEPAEDFDARIPEDTFRQTLDRYPDQYNP